MTGKFLIRLVGVATCMAVVASGWDAEAGWRRHHRRACCEPVCCEPVCCEPVCCERVVYEPACCEPVRTTCCQPACETVCWGTVRETVIVPASSCHTCQAGTTAEPAPAEQVARDAGTKVTPTALKR
mgnify:CR=1 FL=1